MLEDGGGQNKATVAYVESFPNAFIFGPTLVNVSRHEFVQSIAQMFIPIPILNMITHAQIECSPTTARHQQLRPFDAQGPRIKHELVW